MKYEYWIGFGTPQDRHQQFIQYVQTQSEQLSSMDQFQAKQAALNLYVLFRDNLKIPSFANAFLDNEVTLILSHCIKKNPIFDTEFLKKFEGFEDLLSQGGWHDNAANLVHGLVEQISYETHPDSAS